MTSNILISVTTLAVFAPLTIAYAEFQPPKIQPTTPGNYITYQAGQTALFRCEGTLNGVTWFLPQDATDSMKRRISLSHSVNHDHFMTELTIRDLSYTDTGTLTCAYNGTEDLEAIDKSSGIHLFVEDKEHPLKNSGFDFLQVVQSQTFVLPCMPTHPDVIMSLWKQNRRIDRDDKYISYDPKVLELIIVTS